MNTSLLRRVWVTLSSYVIGCYASLLNRFELKGLENIPRQGGVLFASNHISGYETVFIPWAVHRQCPWQMVWAPAKEELFRNRFIGLLFQSWGAFPVKRGRDVRAGRQLDTLLASEKVMLFPEGTRHRDGQLGPGNRGVGKLIYDARPAVVPVALAGLNRWKFPGIGQRGSVTFGPPLQFGDLFQREDDRETQRLIVERVMGAIGEMLAAQAKNATAEGERHGKQG